MRFPWCAFRSAYWLLTGCSPVHNPALSTSYEAAQELRASMARQPKAVRNPIVILGGWRDPGFVAWRMQRAIESVVAPETSVLRLSFGLAASFETARRKLIALVDRELPSADAEWTTKVDVIAFSMGGLVARHAAAQHKDGRRLRLDRLFTIATPHRGARLAFLIPPDPMARAMRPNSSFLKHLEECLEAASYEIVPYTRLPDLVVGASNASPADRVPLWVSAGPLQASHLFAAFDARIQADIMRRLRGEPSLFTEPLAPLPEAR